MTMEREEREGGEKMRERVSLFGQIEFLGVAFRWFDKKDRKQKGEESISRFFIPSFRVLTLSIPSPHLSNNHLLLRVDGLTFPFPIDFLFNSTLFLQQTFDLQTISNLIISKLFLQTTPTICDLSNPNREVFHERLKT